MATGDQVTSSAADADQAGLPEGAAVQAGYALHAILAEVEKVVLGQRVVLEQMLVGLLAGGHLLIEGVPGTAKTLAIVALSRTLQVSFRRLQFTPDLMPSDVTGTNVLNALERRFEFHPGPIFADVVLADEINRAPAKTQAALLEAMQDRQVTIDGTTRALPAPFTVFASQNPLDFEGTYPLPEAQLDRFLLKVLVPYPDESAEVGILDRYAGGFDASDVESFGVRGLLSVQELMRLRGLSHRVRVAPSVRKYIVALTRRTRAEPTLASGASPRASVALFRASQARALIEGRDYVLPEDVKALAIPALRHRVILSPDAEVGGETAQSCVARVVDAVPTPR